MSTEGSAIMLLGTVIATFAFVQESDDVASYNPISCPPNQLERAVIISAIAAAAAALLKRCWLSKESGSCPKQGMPRER